LPGDVRAFLREADRRVRRYLRDGHAPAFVPSDYRHAYQALRAVADASPAGGGLFCEWGSGLGVVACLASLLGFDACGIEAEGGLVDEARRLADDFGLPVEFAHGSFLPAGYDAGDPDEFAWLATGVGSGYGELGLGPDDFDVIFAYPWPDEERLTAALFAHRARAGAILVTYHATDDLRLKRKTDSRRARS
jgi:hypothetical protein